MPTYDFIDTNNNETFSEFMSISEKESFLQSNPHIQQKISAPAIISGLNHQQKQSSAWKDNLTRIAEAHPNSALAEKLGGRSVSKSKVSNAAKKHGLGKKGHYDMNL
jgi:hypothetical protein